MAAPAAGQKITAAMLGQIPQNCTQKVGAAQTTTTITMTTSAQDLTGTSLTFSVAYACTVMIWGVFDVDSTGTGDVFVGTCLLDGTTLGNPDEGHSASIRVTGAQMWIATLTAGSHTIKLQGKKVGTANTVETNAKHTKWHAWVPSP